MKCRIYKARDGWRWRLQAANNRTVADSGEAYTRRTDALRAWEAVCKGLRKRVKLEIDD